MKEIKTLACLKQLYHEHNEMEKKEKDRKDQHNELNWTKIEFGTSFCRDKGAAETRPNSKCSTASSTLAGFTWLAPIDNEGSG